jgi:structural maintenance of chromosome 1
LRSSCWSIQKRSALQAVETQVAALASTVNEAEDTIFADFCERIEVDNIREYEEVQLRVAQRASEARVLYDAQIARLKHQFVDFFSSGMPASAPSFFSNLTACPFYLMIRSRRSTFEAEQLESTKRRLQTLRSSAQEQRTSLEQLQAQKTELEESIQVARDEVHILRQTLEGTQSEAEEKKAALEEVKKLASKSSKVLDKALKEIAESVRALLCRS